jgi:carbonic anhydrase
MAFLHREARGVVVHHHECSATHAALLVHRGEMKPERRSEVLGQSVHEAPGVAEVHHQRKAGGDGEATRAFVRHVRGAA